MSKIEVKPILKTGSSRTADIFATFDEIKSAIGEPNCTQIDDEEKVKASWGFEAPDGRQGFVWCYKIEPEICIVWSATGSHSLLGGNFWGSGKILIIFPLLQRTTSSSVTCVTLQHTAQQTGAQQWQRRRSNQSSP